MVYNRMRFYSSALILFAFFSIPNASAFSFVDNEVQILLGSGFKLGNNGSGKNAKLTATGKHVSVWDYGSNFGFLDLSQDLDGSKNFSYYGEFYPSFSLVKMLEWDMSNGLIRDFTLTPGINKGKNFSAYLLGVRTTLNLPLFNFVNIEAYRYDTFEDPLDRALNATHQITISWSLPIVLSDKVRLSSEGFIDFIGAQGSGVGSRMIAQPQLRIDLGPLFGGQPGKFFAGTELSIWNNKLGVSGVNEFVAQGLFAIKF